MSEKQILLPIRVTPKGGQDCILPFQAGDTTIKLKVSAPPEAGKANSAVIKLLADILKIPKSQIQVTHGEKSRDKQVSIAIPASIPQNIEALLQALAAALKTTSDVFCQKSL